MSFFANGATQYNALIGGEWYTLPMKNITIKNLIPNPSFEQDADWAGIVYDSTQHLYGSRSSLLAGTTVSSAPMPVPIVGHIYYGRNYIFSNGLDIAPADCRFEWYAGDGVGLNFVFAYNNGAHATWDMRSTRLAVEVVNAQSYVVRNFVVNAQNPAYTDGLMIIDLTEAFGAGNEPSQAWCDANIPFFEGEYTVEVLDL